MQYYSLPRCSNLVLLWRFWDSPKLLGMVINLRTIHLFVVLLFFGEQKNIAITPRLRRVANIIHMLSRGERKNIIPPRLPLLLYLLTIIYTHVTDILIRMQSP